MDSFLNSSISVCNIEQDRKRTSLLLRGLEESLNNPHDFKDLGMTAAKFMETLQRSNEQLVKIVGIMKRKSGDNPAKLTAEDKKELYDSLEGNDE